MYFQLTDTNIRLLGSMHRFPAGVPKLPAWVSDAYEWSEALTFETDMDMATILPLFRSSAGTSLKTMLEPNVWAILESIWPSAGPLSPLSSMHLWAALLLAPSFCQETSSGVEPHFVQWANVHSKPTSFLETAQEFAATFASVPAEEVMAGLSVLASDLSAPQRLLGELHTAWLSEDVAGVYLAASSSPTFAYPGLRRAVLESRNRAWAPVVRKKLGTSKRTLIVVGALHLHGPNNLLELLGHSVERIRPAG